MYEYAPNGQEIQTGAGGEVVWDNSGGLGSWAMSSLNEVESLDEDDQY